MMTDKTKEELLQIHVIKAALTEVDFGEPCGHPGCLNHISHPCEGCGRIGGKPATNLYRPPRCG